MIKNKILNKSKKQKNIIKLQQIEIILQKNNILKEKNQANINNYKLKNQLYKVYLKQITSTEEIFELL